MTIVVALDVDSHGASDILQNPLKKGKILIPTGRAVDQAQVFLLFEQGGTWLSVQPWY